MPSHYNYFRDYDPGIGRYLQSDPVGVRGLALLGSQVPGIIDFASDWYALRPSAGPDGMSLDIEHPEMRIAMSTSPWFAMGLSLYGHVDGNPLKFLDALGLTKADKW